MGQALKKTYGLQIKEKSVTHRPKSLAGPALVQGNPGGVLTGSVGIQRSLQEKAQTMDAARRVMVTHAKALKGLANR